ncbi:MAG: preprotein translocase subunit SecA [Muribaculaceae bacterium]|nr:preprotein translocase subunit SecA [Muribaculaceae bacterium]
MGFNDFLKKLFGTKSDRDLKKLMPILDEIKAAYAEIEKLSDDGLRQRTADIRQQLADAVQTQRNEIAAIKAEIEKLDYDKREAYWEKVDKIEKEILEILEEKLNEVLPQVFSIVKETAKRFANNETIVVTATQMDRDLAAEGKDFVHVDGDKAVWQNHWVAGGNETVWDMVHYDVQLIGGTVLHQGKIAEMATGEGKTLVATLPVFLNALTGNGVHVVTVNDYLAKRDSEWMGPLYQFHGLSVACIDKTQPNSPERRAAYNCDITFGTNAEFGFDYLRDNMAMRPEDMVQRKHNYAIVDEVDSVLIDDARTPLIISGPVPKGEDQMFNDFKPNVERVYNAQRRLVTQLLADAKRMMASDDEKTVKEGTLLLYRAFKGLPKYKPLIKFLSEEGVKAAMLKTEAYYMQDNNREMNVVTDPLYFIIEEQNNTVELTDKGIDVLTQGTDDPKFFVLPDIATQLSQVTNEPLSDDEKVAKKDALLQDYSVKAERVHTVTALLKAYTLFTINEEYIVDEEGKVKIVDEQTGRIMEGRRYSDGLHQAIEAKEGVNVEAATQTFATITLQNYFRMYHKLAGMTGTAETEAGEFMDIYKLDVVTIPTNKPVIRNDMPDRVYKTTSEKFNAVIEEIEKMRNSGRPVLVGTTSVDISEKLSRMLTLKHIPHQVLNAKLHQKEADIVAQAGRQVEGKGVVTIATNMAGRGTDIKLSPEVKAAGGLAIIGTERHESRRVDRQLRGRAGRQGDPGSSVFFVSFEDKVMRLFASEKIVKMLDFLGLKDGEAIEDRRVTNAIENAQKRVEENNFGVRKHLLEYDDVMNAQRKVIYTRRHHALIGERIGLDLINTLYDSVEDIVERYNTDEFEDFKMEVLKTYAIEPPFEEETYRRTDDKNQVGILYDEVLKAFNRKSERLAEVANPVIQNIVAQQKEQGMEPQGLIRVPITDGKRVFGIVIDIKEAYETQCKCLIKAWQKAVMLLTIDESWKEHLREMDQLRQSVQNASYEQKDPLVIYKVESFNMFKSMVGTMNAKTISILMRGQIPVQAEDADSATVQQREAPRRPQPRYSESRGGEEAANERQARENQQASRGASRTPQRPTAPIVNSGPKIGRNDPCPCGSGKKYKQCHGKGLV